MTKKERERNPDGVFKLVAEGHIMLTLPLPAIRTLIPSGVIISVDDLQDVLDFLFPGHEIVKKDK